ncbi:hypothetical protein ACIQUL_02950 [Streptomyces sp. NPDC090303]
MTIDRPGPAHTAHTVRRAPRRSGAPRPRPRGGPEAVLTEESP